VSSDELACCRIREMRVFVDAVAIAVALDEFFVISGQSFSMNVL
jgi:hypothetical protein